ncbi:MAG: helix-turn-helix domain-containing protein [Oscillospiraceae bacterium]|nr:helix-turn-helix domain-containing protein [Oscillospiraceae bacterium]
MQKSDNFYNDMGKRIITRRKQLGLSQEELAARADVSPQMISTAERGSKSILSENLLKLSNALDVTADYLLTGRIIDVNANIITQKILDAPPEMQNKIERIIDIMLEK